MCRGPEGERKDTLFTRGMWKKGRRGGQPDWSVEDRPEWNRKGWESQRSLSRRACLDPKKALNRESSKGCERGGKLSGGHSYKKPVNAARKHFLGPRREMRVALSGVREVQMERLWRENPSLL